MTCENGIDFDITFQKRFGLYPKCVDINRQWRIIYLAPGYSFQTQNKDEMSLTHFLTEMYLRGLNVVFYEYRLFPVDDSWIFSWRETNEWQNKTTLAKSRKTKKSLKWKNMEPYIDEFVTRISKQGFLLKKWPGNYEIWNVVNPFLPFISIEWPIEAQYLQKGKISFDRSYNSIFDTEFTKVLNQTLDKYSTQAKINCRENKITWVVTETLSHADYTAVASLIISSTLKLIQKSKNAAEHCAAPDRGTASLNRRG